MKKLLLITFLSISAISVSAQIRFGARAGVNFSSIKIDYADPNVQIDNKSAVSFQLGAYTEFALIPQFFVQPGLELTGLSSKNGSDPDYAQNNLMFIKVPLNFGVRLPVGIGAVSLGTGPYFAYALSGKSKLNGQETDLNFGNDLSDSFKPTDFGLNFFGTYGMKSGLNFTFGYQLGLSDNAPKAVTDQISAKNRGMSFSIGYAIKLP